MKHVLILISNVWNKNSNLIIYLLLKDFKWNIIYVSGGMFVVIKKVRLYCKNNNGLNLSTHTKGRI